MLDVEDRSLSDIIAEYREAVADSHDLPMWVRMVLAFFEYHPDPAWIKAVLSRDGRIQMMRVNKAYQEQVGVSPEQYQGQLDRAIWDAETSAALEANDEIVINSRQPLRTAEFAVHPLTGVKQKWVGWKWPIIIDGKVTAVCGCAVLDREYQDDRQRS